MTMKISNPGSKRIQLSRALLVVLALGILLRLLFPLADPPLNLTVSGAPVGDPGQHSYGARNRVLFGTWSFDDWKPHLTSPLISTALNLVTYRLLGVSFPSHKSIPLLFSLLTLGAFLLLVHRRLTRSAVLMSMLFVALSYPLLMYGRTANRYMPMLFFFILSVHFFIRGVETEKFRHFFFAGFLFLCAYASQNHVLYMVGFFLFLCGFWLFMRRVTAKMLVAFWSMVGMGIASWFFFLFLPNKDFFSHFVTHNSLVRHIYSLPQLIGNIRNTPYAFQFRNDAPILFLAAMGVALTAAWWIRRHPVPPVVEAAAFWFTLGAGFQTIWGYRPTRFYLLMVFPAALLAGWFLDRMIRRKSTHLSLPSWVGGSVAATIAFIVLGGLNYLGYLKRMVASPSMTLFALLFFLIAFILLICASRRWRILAGASLVLFASMVNLYYIRHWMETREYRITETAALINKVLPPSRIAGNWASILSIGGPHRTHLLSGEMGINWRPGFLRENRIRYLLLTRGRFADEFREYHRLFHQQLAQARLLAQFPIFSARVQLYDLHPETKAQGLEMETLTQRPWRVLFDPEASGKMALSPPESRKLTLTFSMPEECETASGIYLYARGKFRGRVRLIQKDQVIRRHLLLGKNDNYEWIHILPGPFRTGQKIEIDITAQEPGCLLDRVSSSPMN